MFAKMNYGVYFFFAALSFLAFFFAFFLIPETSGIPLEAVDRLFEIKPVWKAHSKLKAQLKEDELQFRFEIKDGVFGKEENHAHVENPTEDAPPADEVAA
jgi:Sugar (and other) transporter